MLAFRSRRIPGEGQEWSLLLPGAAEIAEGFLNEAVPSRGPLLCPAFVQD